MAALALWGALSVTAFAAVNSGFFGKTDVFASAGAFSHVSADGARFDDRAGGFRLTDDPAGGYRKDGSFTSEPLHYGFGFDKVVPSWNADCPAGTWVKVEVQTSPDGGDTWSVWYEVAAWGDPAALDRLPSEGKVKLDAMGKVHEDTVELKAPATRLRYRLALHTDRPEATPVVTLVAIAVQNTQRPVTPDDTPGPAWGKEVPAEYRSQLVENADISWRICGPTSTTMALTAHGVSLPTAAVAQAAWDSLDGIYGNWPFLAAAGSRLMRENADSIPPMPGRKKLCQAYVLWCPDWKDVEAEIIAGNPVVMSMNFGKGELDGAPYDSTDGHLILVRGFTKDGDVICNDPNARKESDGRVVYKRGQLHNARHGGPVIVFRPYG
jgi:hypothetical protein